MVFGGALFLTGVSAYEIAEVVSVGGIVFLEEAMTAVFALTFAWISFTATSALSGVLLPWPHISPVALEPTPRAALVECPSSEYLGQRAASFKGGSGSSGC